MNLAAPNPEGAPEGSLWFRSRIRWLVLIGFVVVAAPPSAHAHIRSSVVALDYRASVFPLSAPLREALGVRVYKTDLALGLTVKRGHAVVVLGYLGEPSVRIDDHGVAVNAASPTAAAVGLLKGTRPRPAGTGPAWRRSSGHTAVWHDGRLRGLPSGVKRGEWVVPLVIDGKRVPLAGEVWRVPAPTLWPWVAFGVPFITLAGLVLRSRRSSLLRVATLVFGLGAGVATVAIAMGFMLVSNASEGRWVEGGNELVFAVAGLALVAWGSADVRVVSAGALGLLGITVGVSKLSVLSHGVVLSALPATLTRGTVAFAIWSGAAAVATGLVVFFDLAAIGDDVRSPGGQLGRLS